MSNFTFDNLIFAADKIKDKDKTVDITIGSPEMPLPCICIKHGITTIQFLPGANPEDDLLMLTAFGPETGESLGVVGQLDNAFTVTPHLAGATAVSVYKNIPERPETAQADKVISDTLLRLFDTVVM